MEKLQRDVRLLKAYAFVATLALGVLAFAGFRQADQKTRFTEIDVERINIVEKAAALTLSDPQGRPRLQSMVDAQGAPKLEFLDEQGKVVQRLPAGSGGEENKTR